MPVDIDFPNRTIKVIFKGLIIAAIKEGSPSAEIGALVDSPCHLARLEIVKKIADGPEKTIYRSDPQLVISLEVENVSEPKIGFYRKDGFDRSKEGIGDNDKDDFGYLVDIERDLHTDRPYNPKPGSIRPIFWINNGIFYTDAITQRRMKIKRGQAAPITFGRIANAIAANIYLDQPSSKAVLAVDGTEVLTINADDVAANRTYTITFDCECHNNIGVSDFNRIYGVIEPAIDTGVQVTFEDEQQEEMLRTGSNPDVACVGGRLSRLSQLPT
jgi:hypothetical protein